MTAITKYKCSICRVLINLLNSDEVTIWNALLKITQTILNVVFNQNMTGQNKVIPQKKKIKNQQQIKKKNKQTNKNTINV